jgi:hypothetical protein
MLLAVPLISAAFGSFLTFLIAGLPKNSSELLTCGGRWR